MADPIDLIFQSPLPGNPRTLDLVFGALDTQTSTQTGTLAVTLDLPVFLSTVHYDVNNKHRTFAGSSAGWQVASVQPGSLASIWRPSGKQEQRDGLAWGTATGTHLEAGVPFDPNQREMHSRAVPWETGVQRRASGSVNSSQALPDVRQQAGGAWQNCIKSIGSILSPHQERLRDVRPSTVSPWDVAGKVASELLARVGTSAKRTLDTVAPWQTARRPPAGIAVIPVIPIVPENPCYVPPTGSNVQLVFTDPWTGSTTLIFKCAGNASVVDTIVVPKQKVYIVVNDIALWRVDDNTVIPASKLSLSIDVDSWTYSFSATVPGTSVDAVMPSTTGEPVQLQARINGTNIRLLAETISRERGFASGSISIRGRGIAAVLDAPYSASMSFGNTSAMTASQLMANVLTDNGVSIGWNVDFQLTDWLVPANVWTAQGSYMNALNNIAAAAGGYVQADPLTQTLHVLPRYKAKPWAWGGVTPDFELPSDIVTKEGVEWVNKVGYNRVIVTGTSSGVTADIIRAGSAGDVQAQMVTDALITHSDAAQQRGLAVLSDTGRQANVTLRLPVLSSTGILTPGKFVRYVDGSTTRLGVVRSTSVDASGIDNVWQSLQLETHL